MPVWQKAREVSVKVYRVSSNGEFSKDFGLKDQIRRASVSVLSNISEGFERDGRREFIHFLSISKGSCGEVRAQIQIARDLNYIDEKNFKELFADLEELSKMLKGFMDYLKNSNHPGSKFTKNNSPSPSSQ